VESAVFVSHATMANQRIETDLRRLKAVGPEAGYLSIILVHADKKDEMEKQLEEGYRASAKESVALAGEFEAADLEGSGS
jgi:hypothetical protein